jgi:hypothetical protein
MIPRDTGFDPGGCRRKQGRSFWKFGVRDQPRHCMASIKFGLCTARSQLCRLAFV